MTTTEPAEAEAPKYSKAGRPLGATPEERAISVGPIDKLLMMLRQVHGAKRFDIAPELAQLPRRRSIVVRPAR
jgi:hypothetical protein